MSQNEISTAARRITRTVNEEYGHFHVIFFDEDGRRVGARVGPGDFWPPASEYTYRIFPTLMGMQPVRWTQRMVQDAMDNQDD